MSQLTREKEYPLWIMIKLSYDWYPRNKEVPGKYVIELLMVNSSDLIVILHWSHLIHQHTLDFGLVSWNLSMKMFESWSFVCVNNINSLTERGLEKEIYNQSWQKSKNILSLILHVYWMWKH
jgi:hypothetical protein